MLEGKRVTPDLLKKRKAEVLEFLPRFGWRNLFVCEIHESNSLKKQGLNLLFGSAVSAPIESILSLHALSDQERIILAVKQLKLLDVLGRSTENICRLWIHCRVN